MCRWPTNIAENHPLAEPRTQRAGSCRRTERVGPLVGQTSVCEGLQPASLRGPLYSKSANAESGSRALRDEPQLEGAVSGLFFDRVPMGLRPQKNASKSVGSLEPRTQRAGLGAVFDRAGALVGQTSVCEGLQPASFSELVPVRDFQRNWYFPVFS